MRRFARGGVNRTDVSTDPAELFSRYRGPVYRYLLRGTGDRGVAEELLGDTFVRVVGSLARYTPQGREQAWVFRIAFGVLSNWRRGRARAPVPAELDADAGVEALAPVEHIALDRALASLDADDREVLLLREFGGLDYGEIAELVGATHAAVRSRLYRARISLRGALEPAQVLPFPKERRT